MRAPRRTFFRASGWSVTVLCACAVAQPLLLGGPLRSQLRPLLGEWQCAGKDSGRSRWSFAPDLGGAFVQARYQQQGPLGLQVSGQIGWDEDAERLVATFFASDETLETGSAGDRRFQVRRVFRTTPQGFDWRLEAQQDKEWTKVFEESCRRD